MKVRGKDADSSKKFAIGDCPELTTFNFDHLYMSRWADETLTGKSSIGQKKASEQDNGFRGSGREDQVLNNGGKRRRVDGADDVLPKGYGEAF